VSLPSWEKQAPGLKPVVYYRIVLAGLKTRFPGLKVRGWHGRLLLPVEMCELSELSELSLRSELGLRFSRPENMRGKRGMRDKGCVNTLGILINGLPNCTVSV
jgi:hypothetical protein